MKPLHLTLLAVIASALPVLSQDKNAAPTKAARAYLAEPLVVPTFTPPAAVEPKKLPNIRIDATTKLPSSSGKILTLQRGAASTLPDLPLPPPPKPIQPPRKLTPEQQARHLYQLRHSIRLGGEIYDHKISRVTWTDQETLQTYEAICGFDIGLLVGIGSFVHDGETYSVDLNPGSYDTDNFQLPADKIPTVSEGQILITRGDPNASYAIAPLYFIKDLIASEKNRLLVYQSARRQYQRESTAWEKAHPPVPRDETIVIRPHRGSRYLTNPQPEKKEATR